MVCVVSATWCQHVGMSVVLGGKNLRHNADITSQEPVVTTVYYEKPDKDNGKELVLWKLLLSFNPQNNDSLYMAARAIQMTHGMIHVQQAGLQNSTQHGIFHTPISENGST
jgi:hypothetical protein